MIQKTKRPISILLVLLMIVGMFTVLPISAGAAPPESGSSGSMETGTTITPSANFSSDVKAIFVTDSQGWDGEGAMNVDYWKVKTTGYDDQWNPITETIAGDRVTMTYLYDNTLGQSVYGAVIPDDANWVKFTLASHGSSDTTQVYDGSWWYIDENSNTQLATASAYDTTEQTDSLSAAFVNNTGADEYFVLDGRYYFVDANGNISKYENVQELYVAKDVATGNWYTSVNDAVKAAGEGGTVQLVADIASNVGIDGDYTTTLDLNGKTITNTSGSGITLYSKYNGDKTFTIKDTSENQTGAITINKKYDGDGCISDSSGRKVVIEGGTYTSDANALYVSSDNGWTINGGTFNGNIKVVSALDITGGTITGDINATGPSWKVDPAEVTISGGTVNGSLNSENGSTYEVSGGTFSEPVPAEFCAEGMSSTPDGNGNYTVKSGNFVAQVGDVKYETFAEAVTAANGSLIKILAKDATPYVMSVGQTIVTDNYTKITIVAPEGAYAINRAYDSTAKTYTFTVIDAVASLTVGNTTTYYSSLNSAISAAPQAPTSATVELLRDSSELAINVGSATAKKNVVIDLGGNTLTLTRNYAALFIIRNGSTAVVQNGKVVFDTVCDNASGFYMYDNATKLTLAADLDVEAKGDTAGVYVKNGTFTSAADITAEDSFAICTNGSQTSNATINITGGTLTSDTVAVYLPGDAKVTISGGTITGATAVYVKSGDVTISGGTFTANGAAAEFTHNGNGCNPTGDAIVVESCNYPGGAPTVTISGSPTVTSANAKQIGDYSYGDNALAEVTATSNTMTLPEGLKWVATETEGVYEVAPDYVASVNNSGYMTFADAVDARTSKDDVITLIKAAGTYTGDADEFPIKVAKDGKSVNVKVNGAYLVSSSTAEGVTTYTVAEAAIEYTTLAGAVSYKSNIDYSNMGSSGTYKLLKDITCNSRIVPGLFASNVTVDLNGHTLTSTANDEAFLFSRAGSAASHNSYTITNGTIIAPGDGIQLLANYADLTLDKVTINASGDYGIVTNGTKTGNNITVTDSVITADDAGIYKPSNGALTLTDTSVEGNVAVYVKSGTVAINGGTFTGTGAKADYTYNGNGINPTGDAIVIDSCGYPGGAPSVSIGGNPTITSTNGVEIGDYAGNGVTELAPVTATDNTLTLPEGLKWVEKTEGVYEVAPDYVAEVNGSGYMTFAEAVDARTSKDDVITLIKAAGTYTSDDHTEFPIKVAKSGKSVTVKIEDAPYYTDYSTADGVTTFVAIEGKVKYTSTNGTVTYKGNIDYSNMSGSGTYQLLDDITANSRIVPGLFASNVTVDLNGHTLTSNATDEAFLFSRAGSAASHNSYTITNGTIIAAGDGIQLLANYADLTLDGVTVNAAAGDYGIVTNGTKTGNNITVTDSVITAEDAGIYKPSNGALTLTNTTVEGNVAVYVKSGTVAINGGTFTGTGAKADYTYNGNGINPTGDAIVIDSCGYPGGAPSVSIGGNPTITSTNGVEIGDYAGNGVTELAPVTATDNSLTLPAGLKWVETEAGSGVYEVAPADLFTGHSITLNGYISLNFYIDTGAIPDYANATSVKAKFTWDSKVTESDKHYGDDIVEVNLKDYNPDANGIIIVRVTVNAAQMANTIHAVVEVNGTALEETDDYSVMQYAQELLAGDGYTDVQKTLVKKMLNYGAMAQKVFESQLAVEPEASADSVLSPDDRTAIASEMNGVNAYKIIAAIKTANNNNERGATVEELQAIGTAIGGKWSTTSVIFLSGNTLRHYFDDVNEGQMNTTGYDGVQDTWFYYVEEENIPASQLDTLFDFSIGGQSFKYSVLDYAAALLEFDTSEDVQNLAKALYLYNQAANACFND